MQIWTSPDLADAFSCSPESDMQRNSLHVDAYDALWAQDPRALHQSLRKLCTLNGNTRVLPGHTSSPVAFDGVPISASLERIRGDNPILAEAGSNRCSAG